MFSGVQVSSRTDILQLPANVSGRDFIIADLHGNLSCLENVVNQLNENDRLFIAGDLVDRGNDSLGVVKLISQNPNKIFVACGNHDIMTLNTIVDLEYLFLIGFQQGAKQINIDKIIDVYGNSQNVTQKIRDLLARLKIHLRYNSGRWIVDLFASEVTNQLINIVDGPQVIYSDDSQVKLIYDYFKKLPYIIHVNGANEVMPFNVVHADLPISDAEIQEKLRKKERLTRDERRHAIWARQYDFADSENRGELSDITYCGHNIVINAGIDCVRRDTSHIDLDGSAYSENVSLMANHTESTVTYIGPQSDKVASGEHANHELIKKCAKEAQNYLKQRKLIFAIANVEIKYIAQLPGISFDELVKLYSDAEVEINGLVNNYNNSNPEEFECFDENHLIVKFMKKITDDVIRNKFLEFILQKHKDRLLGVIKSNVEEVDVYIDDVKDDINLVIKVYNKSCSEGAKVESVDGLKVAESAMENSELPVSHKSLIITNHKKYLLYEKFLKELKGIRSIKLLSEVVFKYFMNIREAIIEHNSKFPNTLIVLNALDELISKAESMTNNKELCQVVRGYCKDLLSNKNVDFDGSKEQVAPDSVKTAIVRPVPVKSVSLTRLELEANDVERLSTHSGIVQVGVFSRPTNLPLEDEISKLLIEDQAANNDGFSSQNICRS